MTTRRNFLTGFVVSLGDSVTGANMMTEIAKSAAEVLKPSISIGSKIDKMSYNGLSEFYPIKIDKKQKGGMLIFKVDPNVMPGWSIRSMFLSQKKSYGLFDGGKKGYPNYPNMLKVITDYGKENGKPRKILGAHVTDFFEPDGTMTGYVCDNGTLVGTDRDLKGPKTKGRGMVFLDGETGKTKMKHTKDCSPQEMRREMSKKSDFFPAVSIYRRGASPTGNFNDSLNSGSLDLHKHAHYFCTFKDGSCGLIVLNNCTGDQKRAVFEKFHRGGNLLMAVHNDSDRYQDPLNQILLHTDDHGLRNSHPANDIFSNPGARGEKPEIVIKDTMPGVIVHFAQYG